MGCHRWAVVDVFILKPQTHVNKVILGFVCVRVCVRVCFCHKSLQLPPVIPDADARWAAAAAPPLKPGREANVEDHRRYSVTPHEMAGSSPATAGSSLVSAQKRAHTLHCCVCAVAVWSWFPRVLDLRLYGKCKRLLKWVMGVCMSVRWGEAVRWDIL